MIITPLELYLILKLDAIVQFGVVIISAGFGLGILLGTVTALNWDSNSSLWRDFPKTMKALLIIFVLMPLIGTGIVMVVPTTKQMATIIVAPKIINSVANNEGLKNIPNNLLKLANTLLTP